MNANVTYPCPEEDVLFTCTTSESYLRWKIIFSDGNIVHQNIERFYSVGAHYVKYHRIVELLFVVTSTSGSLSSTLSMTSSNNLILNNTKIECAGDSTVVDYIYYRISGMQSCMQVNGMSLIVSLYTYIWLHAYF